MCADDTSSEGSDIIINTRTSAAPEKKADVDGLFQEDRVGKQLHKLYLESQGFPVELPTDELIAQIRLRKWLVDTRKALTQLMAVNDQTS